MLIKSGFSRCWQTIGGSVALVGTLLAGMSNSLAQVVPDSTLGRESSIVTPDTIRNIGSGSFAVAEGIRIDGGAVRGTRFEMAQSNVWADTLGTQNGGEVLIQATEVDLSDSLLNTDVAATATGTGGNLTINTDRLTVRGGAQVLASTTGSGKGGRLLVTADAIELVGASADDQTPSGLLAATGGKGDAGNLSINTGRLLVRDGAQVAAGTFSEGNAGNLLITADSIEAIGQSARGRIRSGLFAESLGRGNAGNLRIDTRQLLVRDGAQVSSGTLQAGKGGNLQITADSVEVIGETSNGQRRSSLFSQSAGSGNAGDLKIETRRLIVQGGAEVTAGTLGEGKGGNLHIAADSVEAIGTSADGTRGSFLVTQSAGSGDAGDLRIETRQLSIRDGAQVSAGTFDKGNAGVLQISAADLVEVSGRAASGKFGSALATQSDKTAIGNAGDLKIDTRRLVVQGGAQVSTGTLGQGKGGNLQIAADSIDLSGSSPSAEGLALSGLFASSTQSGNAGDVTIETRNLRLRDRAIISSSSAGIGTAGNISITARDTLQLERSTIRTDSTQTQGGAIDIRAGKIRLFNSGDIRSDVASGASGGGNIFLKANSILAFGDSDILAFARDGRGDITLNTKAFFGENYRPARSTDPNTLNGNNRVDINATGAVSGIITIPDVTFIQNSLVELPDTQINTDTLLANSCIVRRDQPPRGSFRVTGTGGFEQRPGEPQTSSFPTVSIETLPSQSSTGRTWRKGDSIV